MFDTLTQRLSRVVKSLRGEARLTDANITEALREVRLALLEADVALPVVKDFIAAVKAKAVGEEVVGSLTPGQALIGVVHRELAALMGTSAAPLDLATQPPAVLLLAGLQGAGKTTTAAKLARLLKLQKKKVLVVSVDVHRPGCGQSSLGSVKRSSGPFLVRSRWFWYRAELRTCRKQRCSLFAGRTMQVDLPLGTSGATYPEAGGFGTGGRDEIASASLRE